MLTSTFAPSPLYSFLGAKGYCVVPEQYDVGDGEPPGWQVVGLAEGYHLPYGHQWTRQPPIDGMAFLDDLGGVWCKSGSELWLAMWYWMIMLISGASGGDTNREDMLPGEQFAIGRQRVDLQHRDGRQALGVAVGLLAFFQVSFGL